MRILWVFRHRTARYEEVRALLRQGAEVVPIAGEFSAFPNAVELPEDQDPWNPPWRETCTIPAEDLEVVRSHDYYADARIPPSVAERLNRWFDVVFVGTWPAVAERFLESFRGTVVLRPYGGFPYTRSLGSWIRRAGRLDRLAANPRYVFCPAIPYQRMVEDPRLAQSEVFWPACVTSERLGSRWAAADSAPEVCEVISLVERYRKREYDRFLADYGDLPLRIFGQNAKHLAGVDPRVVGTLPDAEYYGGIANARAMIYVGIGSKYHLHYHALEALTMGVPVIFFERSALAHIALYLGHTTAQLGEMGMAASPAEAKRLAQTLLGNPRAAMELSARQTPLRSIFSPASWDGQMFGALQARVRLVSYVAAHRDPVIDAAPLRGFPLRPEVLRDLGARTARRLSRILRGRQRA